MLKLCNEIDTDANGITVSMAFDYKTKTFLSYDTVII